MRNDKIDENMLEEYQKFCFIHWRKHKFTNMKECAVNTETYTETKEDRGRQEDQKVHVVTDSGLWSWVEGMNTIL